MNTVALSGRLTDTPTLRETKNGKPFATFGLAVDDSFRSGVTHFFNVVAFRDAAERVRELPKGTLIGLTGQLQAREYTTKEGQQRKTVEVCAERAEVIATVAVAPPDAQDDGYSDNPFADQ